MPEYNLSSCVCNNYNIVKLANRKTFFMKSKLTVSKLILPLGKTHIITEIQESCYMKACTYLSISHQHGISRLSVVLKHEKAIVHTFISHLVPYISHSDTCNDLSKTYKNCYILMGELYLGQGHFIPALADYQAFLVLWVCC